MVISRGSGKIKMFTHHRAQEERGVIVDDTHDFKVPRRKRLVLPSENLLALYVLLLLRHYDSDFQAHVFNPVLTAGCINSHRYRDHVGGLNIVLMGSTDILHVGASVVNSCRHSGLPFVTSGVAGTPKLNKYL